MLDDVAADRLNSHIQVFGCPVSQDEMMSYLPHEVRHGGQEFGIAVVIPTRATRFSRSGVPCLPVTGYVFTPLPHPGQKLEIVHLSCLTLQFVAGLWMGDTDELACPFPDAAAAKLRHAVLGYHAVYCVLERSDRRARM